MKEMILGAMCMSLLVACEQQEVCVNEGEYGNNLRIEAEISPSGFFASRTTTTAEGKVTFAENDKIGFFAPQISTSGSWTFSDNDWTTDQTYTWPDKLSTHIFCAYYPFAESVSRDAVAMPNLLEQNGLLNELNKFDFLVARCSTSYADNNGVVSFTGGNAFKHVYALIAITLKANAETDGSALTDISLKAENLMTAHTYHFGETSLEDGMADTGEKVNELSLTGLDTSITTAGCKQVFVVNPLSSDSMTITVKYSRDGQNYTASTSIPATGIKGGNLNKLNITIKKSGLLVDGNTVEDWIVTDLDDAVVEENPLAE